MKKLAVIALGGNALLRGNQLGTIKEQEENTYQTCLNIVEFINRGYNVVITHGNGPQVGNILLRNEAGFDSYKIPKMPLDICVADSQGGIGYMLERQLKNILVEKKLKKSVITFVTQVLVEEKDPAFQHPTKPVGKYFIKEEADLLARVNNWVFKEDPRKRGYRRVVASPKPVDIVNKDVIKDLAKKGNIVIAVGGGGIPIIKHDGKYFGIEAVIDKDLASSLLATEIGADEFIILTDVPKVCINFHQSNEKQIDKMSIRTAQKYQKQGQFAAGSMGPKIQSILNFIRNGGASGTITEANELKNPDSGTIITP
ncbi:MAG: carbamate kinase [Ignavibacteriaceae bacterium]